MTGAWLARVCLSDCLWPEFWRTLRCARAVLQRGCYRGRRKCLTGAWLTRIRLSDCLWLLFGLAGSKRENFKKAYLLRFQRRTDVFSMFSEMFGLLSLSYICTSSNAPNRRTVELTQTSPNNNKMQLYQSEPQKN